MNFYGSQNQIWIRNSHVNLLYCTINSWRFTDVYNPNSQNVCGIFLILIKFDIFAIMTTKEKKVFFIYSFTEKSL